MDVLEEYKELYYKEIEYTERLNSKINICITFLTIIGSGVMLVWSKIESVYTCKYFWVYLSLCITSSVLFSLCIIFFYRTYYGYKINYYPIKEMAISFNETYILANKGQIKKKQADKHVRNMMAERYLNDAIHNREQNRLKNDRHRRLINLVAVTFVILIINYATGIYFSNCIATDNNIINCQYCGGGDTNGE